MNARPIPALGTHSAFTEIVTAVVGRWQHLASGYPAQKANPVLPRCVTVASNGSNYVTLCIFFFADMSIQQLSVFISVEQFFEAVLSVYCSFHFVSYKFSLNFGMRTTLLN